MLNRKMKPIAAAVGAAFATSLTGGAFADTPDPFETRALEGVLLAKDHMEGGCGEDRDASKEGDEGKSKAEGNCGEGNCGEGNCGEGKSKAEGSDGDSDADAGDGETEEGEAEAPASESDS